MFSQIRVRFARCFTCVLLIFSFACENSGDSDKFKVDYPFEIPVGREADSSALALLRFDDLDQRDSLIQNPPGSLFQFPDFGSGFGCGNGIQSDGELCFQKPVIAAAIVAGELSGIDVGFINGGSKLDFVVALASNDKIRFKLGSGDGTFFATYSWTMGDGPTDVALADFDNDGKTDIIATNGFNSRVRIRWGQSSWSTYSSYTTGAGPWRVATGDLNSDGRDDFVTINGFDDNISVRLRKAGGGFTNDTYGAGTGTYDIKLADCDNDGDLDIFYSTGVQQGLVRVMKNKGNGTFGAASEVNMGGSDNFYSITLGDYNNDGNIDMIGARSSHSLVRVLGNGDGTFQNPVAAPVVSNPWQIYTHDFDLDGNQDIIVAHLLASTISIYLGEGNGNFGGPYIYDSGYGVVGVNDVGVGDFNGDGSPDIVFTYSNTGIYIMLSNP